MNMLQQLQVIMPGQPIAWYERIAAEIDAGRMPMPHLTPPKASSPPPPPMLPEVEIIRPKAIENIPESEPLQPEPPPRLPEVEVMNPTVYSFTKEELSNPADDVKPPKVSVSRKTKKKAEAQQKKTQKENQKKATPKAPKQRPPIPSKPPASPVLYAPIAEASPPLSRDLLILCRNDHKLAERLVKHQLYLHPEKDFKWAQEKVIWDLERDRR